MPKTGTSSITWKLPSRTRSPEPAVHGEIDAARRRDHMQQHSAQHVLSAAFVRLFKMPTVSFHMADDYCSIDLDTPSLSKEQIESAERLANEIVLDNRPVDIRFVKRDEAAALGLRKLPPTERDQLRLIDIRDFDLTACGGTHVNHTGQIGGVFLRKTEKVRQGYRVEFVAGQRAVATARRDFNALTETAALFSAHIYDVPQQARKSLDEIRLLRKQIEQSQEELAAAQAATLIAETPESQGRKLVVRTFSGRDLNFIKLLAQKLTRQSPALIALLATESPQPALVFAQSPGQPHDMGALLKETMAKLGGRGGGEQGSGPGRGAPVHRTGRRPSGGSPIPHPMTRFSAKQKPPTGPSVPWGQYSSRSFQSRSTTAGNRKPELKRCDCAGPPFSHQTAGSSGRLSICESSFLISTRRLARISTADWSIWLSAVLAAERAFMLRKSVIS